MKEFCGDQFSFSNVCQIFWIVFSVWMRIPTNCINPVELFRYCCKTELNRFFICWFVFSSRLMLWNSRILYCQEDKSSWFYQFQAMTPLQYKLRYWSGNIINFRYVNFQLEIQNFHLHIVEVIDENHSSNGICFLRISNVTTSCTTPQQLD